MVRIRHGDGWVSVEWMLLLDLAFVSPDRPQKGTWWTPLATCDWVRVYAQSGEQCASGPPSSPEQSCSENIQAVDYQTSQEKQVTLNPQLFPFREWGLGGVSALLKRLVRTLFSFSLTPATHAPLTPKSDPPLKSPSHWDYRFHVAHCPPEGRRLAAGGWHHRFNRHEHEQTPGESEGTGRPGVLQPTRSQRVNDSRTEDTAPPVLTTS